MSQEPVPVAVVGAGGMGSHHIRVYQELQGANLVEVVEPEEERAAEIRMEHNVPVRSDISRLTTAQAASVAVPSTSHRAVAQQCIEAGIDLLVEKPLATTPADAQAIIDAATAADAILQVGHIERFNPAIQTLEQILSEQELVDIETHRLGPFTDHLGDKDVVFDLMIHDLDILMHLVPGEVIDFEVLGSHVESNEPDHVSVQIQFGNGTIGKLTASHVTSAKIRTLDVVTDGPYINVDYQAQDVTLQRTGIRRTMTLPETSGYKTETITETPYVGTREPLKNELEHFIECVRTRTEPAVSGADGIRAVELAGEISDRIADTG